MATQPGPLTQWPWQRLGKFKYLFLVPLIVKATYANVYHGYDKGNWCLHMLVLMVLRSIHGQVWLSLSRFYPLVQKYEIQSKPINFEQVDRESNWGNYLIWQAIVLTFLHILLPDYNYVPCWNKEGIVILFLLHAGPVEFLYYWAHRGLHHHYLFSRYHSHHHKSCVSQPISGFIQSFPEHILYSVLLCLPLLGVLALGKASIGMVYFYTLFLDFMTAVGHCNWEFVPPWLFRTFPFLKYLVYTPTFHSLHHSQVHTNFCLFMPVYDYLGGTVDKNTDSLYEAVRKGRTDKGDFIFLVHGVGLTSMFQLPFTLTHLSALPFDEPWYLWPLIPISVVVLLLAWITGLKPFIFDKYKLRNQNMETWITPRFAFQYFLPFDKPHINHVIEHAILKADRMGAKVISLGALNKNENLNGGGALFVSKHPNLRVRITHGNTLTTAVMLDKLPKNVSEIFLTGSTSKIGRAIALYLCKRRVRVLMLTTSRNRFESIQNEAPSDCRGFLVHVTKYEAGQQCKIWMIGKTATPKEQQWAPAETHFHQFAVPFLEEVRKDSTYGKMAGMYLPKDVKGLRSCELSMPRGAVHACHAGGLVHFLEGWEHNEVGPIDVDRIDLTWKAALSYGFRPL